MLIKDLLQVARALAGTTRFFSSALGWRKRPKDEHEYCQTTRQSIEYRPSSHYRDRRVHRAYQAGYKFHRSAVRNSPEILSWVLRDDYWDYRLPRQRHGTETTVGGTFEKV
jgi:hypothetical protein